MIKGVIMDLDGTLLDSMCIWEGIAERYLIAEGYEPAGDLAEIVGSLSIRQACEKMRVRYQMEKTTDELIAGIVAAADDAYRYEVPLKPGAASFLRELYEKGIMLCVATADDRSLTEAALERNGVLQYFMKIFSCNDLHCGKEEPTIYFAAAEHMGLESSEVCVFEDSLYALKTAKNAGFYAAAVFDAHEKAQEEMKRTADVYLEDMTGSAAEVLDALNAAH